MLLWTISLSVQNSQRNSLTSVHLLLVLCDWTGKRYQSLPSWLHMTQCSTAVSCWTLSSIRPNKWKLSWCCQARQRERRSPSPFSITMRTNAGFNVQTDVNKGRMPTTATCSLIQHTQDVRHQQMDYIQEDNRFMYLTASVLKSADSRTDRSINVVRQPADSSIYFIAFNHESTLQRVNCQLKSVCKRIRTTVPYATC